MSLSCCSIFTRARTTVMSSMAGSCHHYHANHNHHHHSNDHDHHLHACKNNCDVFYGRQSLSPQYLANHRHGHRDNHHDRHLHACKNSCTFFCAREDELEKMKEYITGPSQKVEKSSLKILKIWEIILKN